MIDIHKGTEPRLLTEYRHQKGACWDGPAMEDGTTFTEVKAAIRCKLWEEQHGLCAYCMCRIPKGDENACKIEHYKPRSLYPDKELDYGNLLLCCTGNKQEFTCDSSKDNLELKHLPNPAQQGDVFAASIKYGNDASIVGKDLWQADIDKILNLNSKTLKKNRLAVKKRLFKCSKIKIFIEIRHCSETKACKTYGSGSVTMGQLRWLSGLLYRGENQGELIAVFCLHIILTFCFVFAFLPDLAIFYGGQAG